MRNKRKILSRRVFFSKAEEDIYKKIVSARVKLSKMKNKLKKHKAEIKISKSIVCNYSSHVLANSTSIAKLLIKLQGRENIKKEKGRRFTIEEKIASLSIFKHSPKAYKFLRSIFILPAPQTLIKLIHKSKLKPGINKNIFTQLKKRSESIKNSEKLCVLLFDEVSLKVNVAYQGRRDEVAGFADNGVDRTAEYADHALVFMIRGLLHNYKQPIYYTFSKNCTKGSELAKQIKEVIKGVQDAGFIVLATICDQGTNNRQALKWLLNETRGIYLRRNEQPKENIILINNREVIPLYDPPHLIKGMRNNLITKNLQYVTNDIIKTAKWCHLEHLYKENPGYNGIRLIPKMTESHVNPDKMNKMKVKFATQIFSRTVASNLGYLAGNNY